MIDLPDKMSELIQVAITDAKQINRHRYRADSDTWHSRRRNSDYQRNRRCSVCLAGVVIASTLEADFNARLYPTDFGESIDLKLEALDSIRQRNFRLAFDQLARASDEFDYDGESGEILHPVIHDSMIHTAMDIYDDYDDLDDISLAEFENWKEMDRLIQALEKIVDVFKEYGL